MPNLAVAESFEFPTSRVDPLAEPDESAAALLKSKPTNNLSICAVITDVEADRWRVMRDKSLKDGKEPSSVIMKEVTTSERHIQVLARALTLKLDDLEEGAETAWGEHAGRYENRAKIDRGFQVAMSISCKVDARNALEQASVGANDE